MAKTVEELREETLQVVNLILLHNLVRPMPEGNYIDPENSNYREWLLREINQILSIFLDQTKDDCQNCLGKGYNIFHNQYNEPYRETCCVCDGTGKGEWHPERLVRE